MRMRVRVRGEFDCISNNVNGHVHIKSSNDHDLYEIPLPVNKRIVGLVCEKTKRRRNYNYIQITINIYI